MNLEQEIKELTAAVRNLAAVMAGSANIPANIPATAKPAAPAADTKAPPPPAADKVVLNKDGETPTYTKEVKPALMAFVKSHGREFVLEWLKAKGGYGGTGLTPIKGGESYPGEYAIAVTLIQEGQKQDSPIAAIA
jgi:hypothetical protein